MNEERSVAYAFALNMWIMKKINEKFLEGQVSKKRLTDFEKDMILATPQISE